MKGQSSRWSWYLVDKGMKIEDLQPNKNQITNLGTIFKVWKIAPKSDSSFFNDEKLAPESWYKLTRILRYKLQIQLYIELELSTNNQRNPIETEQ